MRTVRLTSGETAGRPCVATIGFFDGVHRGHRYLISHVIDTARREGMESAVVTFDRHPRQVLHSDYRPQLLSTTEEKLALLAQTGIDRCAMLPFDAEMAALPARDFMRDVLLGRLGVRRLVIGYDNRFGHDRTEGFDDYVRHGRELGIAVEQWQPMSIGGVNVSSSMVRSLLQAGEVEMASRCLGYDYRLGGTVVHGRHVGSSLGFPTANVQPADPLKLVPARGVYAAEVSVEGEPDPMPAMLNIGNRPTFGDGSSTTIEAHLIGFAGDLYGRGVSVSFVARLRDERKFRTAAELACQLRRDLMDAEREISKKNQPNKDKQQKQ